MVLNIISHPRDVDYYHYEIRETVQSADKV